MRIERWYWLLVFCCISFIIHIGMVMRSRAFVLRVPEATKPTEIEVALEPPALEKPKEAPKPKKDPPTPKPKAEPKREKIKEPANLAPRRSKPVRVASVKRTEPIRIARNTVKPEPATTRERVEKPVPTPRRDPGA